MAFEKRGAPQPIKPVEVKDKPENGDDVLAKTGSKVIVDGEKNDGQNQKQD